MRREFMALTATTMLSACFGPAQMSAGDSLPPEQFADAKPKSSGGPTAPRDPGSPAGHDTGRGNGSNTGGGLRGDTSTNGRHDPTYEPRPPRSDPSTHDGDQMPAEDPESPLDPEASEDQQLGEPTEPVADKSAPFDAAQAGRLMRQATFGGNKADIDALVATGPEAWVAAQMEIPVLAMTDRVRATPNAKSSVITDLFWEYAVEHDDQLRQRMVFALSQIVVVSNAGSRFYNSPIVMAAYTDILQRNAFGNYEDLVREIALQPSMGLYLSHLKNEKADPELGTSPDENFAREVMQLFTIGLEELSPGGEPLGRETYTTADVTGLAKVFTGFSWADTSWNYPAVNETNKIAPMQGYPDHHEPGPKTFLGYTVPGGLSPEQSFDLAMTHLLGHPNVAPFITRQLIQRLVTSNPSPDYVARVAAAYDTGVYQGPTRRFGAGRRGDMKAVAAAILLDEEARSIDAAMAPEFGKLRSPVLRFANWARTFRDDRDGVRTGEPVTSGNLRSADRLGILGQKALAPPSVFGFSRPGYVAPGSWTGNAELKAPGMTFASGVGMIGYLNMMREYVSGKIDSWAVFFQPDYDDLLPLAADPDALADALNQLIGAGEFEQATKERIAAAVATIPLDDENDPAMRRVKLAVFMAVTAPSYSVQR